MNPKTKNDRCPLQTECERKCTFKLKELECDYYWCNARQDYIIEDQEEIRQARERAADEEAMEAMLAEEDDEEEQEIGSDAEEKPEVKALNIPKSYAGEAITYLDGPRGVTEKIKQAMYNAAKEFVYIGFLLWEVQKYGYFREHGYESVYEYAEHELNFKRSSTKNMIAICKEFSGQKTQWKTNKTVQYIGQEISNTLQTEYKQFNYSQLCEMLALAPAKREQVTPDMTVREIRKLKKQTDHEPDLPPNDTGQTSGQEEKLQTVTINNYWKDLPPEIIKALVKASGLQYNQKSCYTITVELKKA